MHRPLSALDVGPKVSSALTECCPIELQSLTKNNSVPCPKSRTTYRITHHEVIFFIVSSVRDQRKFEKQKSVNFFTRCDKKSSYSKPEFCDLVVWWFSE